MAQASSCAALHSGLGFVRKQVPAVSLAASLSPALGKGRLGSRRSAVSHASRFTAAQRAFKVQAQAAVSSSGVTEVDISTYDAAVEAAGDKLVVLDMFTQWCGPCKLIAPKLEVLAQKYEGSLVILKLDCNEVNKPLAKSLGVRVVPTFKLIRNKEVFSQVEGAKYDDLVAAIVKELTAGSSASGGAQAASPSVIQPGKMVEVDKDTFYPALQEAGDRLVLLDMFTDWCGPCKFLAPKISELASLNTNVVFLKLNCNEFNKPLAKALGIVSVPTVKFFKSGEFIDEVRGNKFELIAEKVAKLS